MGRVPAKNVPVPPEPYERRTISEAVRLAPPRTLTMTVPFKVSAPASAITVEVGLLSPSVRFKVLGPAVDPSVRLLMFSVWLALAIETPRVALSDTA